jgi:hypothetical protein
MKGVVFTEFIEMVEHKFGFEISDRIISNANLPSGGVYTSVGTYPESEMISLLISLEKEVKIEIPDLLNTFGYYLFGRFSVLYPHFFVNKNSAFEFLKSIQDYIHVEVLKLYPDAKLPTIHEKIFDETKMELIYSSERKLGHLALGLIKGCADHFNEKIQIEMETIEKDGSKIKFVLTKE